MVKFVSTFLFNIFSSELLFKWGQRFEKICLFLNNLCLLLEYFSDICGTLFSLNACILFYLYKPAKLTSTTSFSLKNEIIRNY